jgi:hypothetical protein
MNLQRNILILLMLVMVACQSISATISGDNNELYADRTSERVLLTQNDLLEGFQFAEPLPESALAYPVNALPASHVFEGRLELIGEAIYGGRRIYTDNTLGDDTVHLPKFDFEFIQYDDYLIPVQRGLIIANHQSWNYHLEPGRVWDEAGDGDFSRASFPFALSWKGSNATLNGTMTFLFNDDGISKVWYQVTQETTINTSLDLWGLLDAKYHPGVVASSRQIKADFSRELSDRFPTKPIETLKKDYPAVNLEMIGYGVSPDHMTWYAVVIDGIQYLGGCQTRYGTYPYCEYMRAPSYSTAKSSFASLALMRLNKKYQESVSDSLIKDYLPEAANSQGAWAMVTFDHALDMSTGNYQTSNRMVDEERWDTDPFWSEDYYEERLQAALDWPSSSHPGEVWVYRTSDTFILTAAMQKYLVDKEGESADIFQFAVDEIYQPLGMSPGVFSTARTKDDNWQGLPFGGYGLWWIPDDLAKISTFLNLDHGRIDQEQILDLDQLKAALQQDPQDRGVIRDGDGRYNNAFWADQYSSRNDPSCIFWVPHMYGYSGIVVSLLPNGIVYYYASDNQEFRTVETIQELEALKPICQD